MAMAADKRKQKAKGKSRVTKETQAAAKDPGPPYRALWHPAADVERDASWPPEEKVAMLHAVQKLEAAGPRLGSTLQRGSGRGGPRAARASTACWSQPVASDLPSR